VTVALYDTTLRDGAQTAGITYSVEDKLRIAEAMDRLLGVAYVEGGYAGASEREDEFFARARERALRAKIVAFGSCARPGTAPERDEGLAALLAAGTSAVCIFGKAAPRHVREALRTSLEENLQNVAGSVARLVREGREVIFDAEHFFDGYAEDPGYALAILRAAKGAGAHWIVLCDTNGGTAPWEVGRIVGEVVRAGLGPVGFHGHNDMDTAVAASLEAVRAGATQVQGTVNGYGERCGNANLCSVAPALELKLGVHCLPAGALSRLTEVANLVADISNRTLASERPFVGRDAFAHKAGVHASAQARCEGLYEHIDPEAVGNERRTVVSELGGRATILEKVEEMGLPPLGDEAAQKLARQVKKMEAQGYQFDSADGTFELLVRRATGEMPRRFDLERLRVLVERHGRDVSETVATVAVTVDGKRHFASSEGDGPVHALDRAARAVLEAAFPVLRRLRLRDYKVRTLDGGPEGTAAQIRVLVESEFDGKHFTTVGVSTNLIEASWEALVQSFEVALGRAAGGGEKRQSA
jgi:2-isopropylmalate synthase